MQFMQCLTPRAATLRIEIVFSESGPVAQLGARFHGMEEVTGSIPVRSTNNPLHAYGLPNRLACGNGSRSCCRVTRVAVLSSMDTNGDRILHTRYSAAYASNPDTFYAVIIFSVMPISDAAGFCSGMLDRV